MSQQSYPLKTLDRALWWLIFFLSQGAERHRVRLETLALHRVLPLAAVTGTRIIIPDCIMHRTSLDVAQLLSKYSILGRHDGRHHRNPSSTPRRCPVARSSIYEYLIELEGLF